jgi:hypothetical protein
MSSTKHKVFISFHHAADELYKNRFEYLFAGQYDIVVNKSVQIGEIDPFLTTETVRQKIRDEYLKDTTVTVVLIGKETWKRKHVDWEISSSIRDTKYNSRSGLLGILLPTYPFYSPNKYNPYTIPPRLYDNIKCGFADIYLWNEDPLKVKQWIHNAFEKRFSVLPDNSYPIFANNRPSDQREWQP